MKMSELLKPEGIMCMRLIWIRITYINIKEINYMCSCVLLLAQAHVTHIVWSDRGLKVTKKGVLILNKCT